MEYYLKIRRQEGLLQVQCWLIRKDGPTESGIMYGEVLSTTVETLSKLMGGLKIVDDSVGVKTLKPTPKLLPRRR